MEEQEMAPTVADDIAAVHRSDDNDLTIASTKNEEAERQR